MTVSYEIADAFSVFLEPHRYKVAYGGRAGMRTWTVARLLLTAGIQSKKLILCTREYQTAIKDSVHRVLAEQLELLGYKDYEVLKDSIRCRNGTEIIFKGLRHNPTEIKSTEGVDICWVEEAENTSAESWDILLPTIRKPGSEIYVTFNPRDEDAPTYERFVKAKQPDQVTVVTTYMDTASYGWLPKEVKDLADSDRKNNIDRYEWVWLGQPRRITESSIFGDKVAIRDFNTPDNIDRFYYGMDFGFANDPSVVLRCYIVGDTLYIDQEASGVGIEIVDLPALVKQLPGGDKWPIVADCSRPETISHMKNAGLNMYKSKKWPGCVEDGIEYLRGFTEIVIHPRCSVMVSEGTLYSYKTDKKTGHILPIVLDAHNHAWDSLRYALESKIKNRSGTVSTTDYSASQIGL